MDYSNQPAERSSEETSPATKTFFLALLINNDLKPLYLAALVDEDVGPSPLYAVLCNSIKHLGEDLQMEDHFFYVVSSVMKLNENPETIALAILKLLNDEIKGESHPDAVTSDNFDSDQTLLLRRIQKSESYHEYGLVILGISLRAHEKRLSAAIGAVAIGYNDTLLQPQRLDAAIWQLATTPPHLISFTEYRTTASSLSVFFQTLHEPEIRRGFCRLRWTSPLGNVGLERRLDIPTRVVPAVQAALASTPDVPYLAYRDYEGHWEGIVVRGFAMVQTRPWRWYEKWRGMVLIALGIVGLGASAGGVSYWVAKLLLRRMRRR